MCVRGVVQDGGGPILQQQDVITDTLHKRLFPCSSKRMVTCWQVDVRSSASPFAINVYPVARRSLVPGMFVLDSSAFVSESWSVLYCWRGSASTRIFKLSQTSSCGRQQRFALEPCPASPTRLQCRMPGQLIQSGCSRKPVSAPNFESD